ncbi:ABC transporter substrate-binding protein [Actinocrinis puniceicyclus]|uniref:ABC transporter substrate-binding protein n=1 Tax=Actinocrinis puniceicyclus TaxID=977794 RepID=A0A8J7WPD2_9ACTN|nr:ABC transporter substrate-binding protein [Actinocrinis puniceicyclus]MBS2963852.1 ABC transporter substrate-binding protein [Actinocrinis puniceicyclus]
MFRKSVHPRALAGAAAITALALTASACGSSPKPSSTNAGGAKSSTLTIESAPVSPFTDNFNPFVQTSIANQVNATSLLYEPLLQWNITKANSYYPWLADSFTWNSTGTAITIKLHAGVKWSDGQPLTAKDVAFTFNLMKATSALNANGLPIVSATAADDTTATITFSSSQYTNLYAITGQTFIVPEHIWTSQTDPAHWTDPSPVGSGPFTLDKFSAQGFTLKANANYWQGAPKVSEISFPSYVSNTTANQALDNGQIDWAGNYVTNIDQTYVAKDPKNNHYYFPATNTVVLILNVTKAPFNDVKVRQAVSAAVNRTELSQVGETNYEPPATSSSGLLLPEFSDQVPSDLANDLPAASDANKVTSIMTAAGYAKDGSGIWAKNNKEVSFAIEDPSSYTDYYTCATLISQELKPLGFKVSVNGVTPDKWTADLNAGSFDAAIHWGGGGPSPYQQYDNWLDYGTSAAIGQTANGDYGRYNNPAVQSALKAWAGTNDPNEITKQLGIVAHAMSTDVPDVVLMYGAGWNEYSTKHFTGWPTKDNSYIDPRPNNPWLEYTVLHLTPVS